MEAKSVEQLNASEQAGWRVPSAASTRTIKSATVTVKPAPPPPIDNDKKVAAWRENSRYASYADMAVTILGLIQCAVLIAIASWVVYETHNREGFQGIKVFSIILLTLFLIQLVSHIRGLWMACKLYSATNPSTAQPEAIEKAKRWRKFHTFKIILAMIIGVITSTNGPSVGSLSFVWFFLRIVFICIVHKYIREMEKNSEDAEIRAKSAASVHPVMTIEINEVVQTAPPSVH